MKFRRYAVAAILLMAMAGGDLYAATPDPDDTFSLGDIVVKGEKTDVADIGISQVITDVEIKATNSTTLAEALKFAPGITMTRGSKNEPEVSIHGFGSEKTLFLIDGIPYYETYYGKLNLDQIPVGIISKIEITKNAPSVLYGANAQIAVINVVTKKGTQKPSLSLQGEIGENGTYSGGLSHGNQIGAVNYWLSYLHEESDGWRMSDDFEPTEVKGKILEDGGFRINSDYKKDKFWARMGITPTTDSEYFVSFHIMDSEFGHPLATDYAKYFPKAGDKPAFSSYSRFDDYRDWGVDLSGKHTISSALTLRGKLFYHDHQDVYVSYDGPDFDTVVAESTYKDNFVGGSLFGDFQFADMHKGHVSLHFKQDTHEGRDDDYLPYNKYEAYTGSIGTEHEFFTNFGLALYAGASYDWFDITEAQDYVYEKLSSSNYVFEGQTDMETPSTMSEFNPMAGFTWEKDQIKVYGSVAKKTRFPTLGQLYSSSSGNPDLTAEKSINYTLGVTKAFGKRVTADVSGFYHDISGWISRDYVQNLVGDDVYSNVEDVSMLGFETSVKVVFCDYFSVNANYTYNHAKDESDNRVTDKVAGVPENKYGLGCALTIPKVLVKVDLQGIYVDTMYEDLPTPLDPTNETTRSDDYFILNTRISKKFRDRMSVYVSLNNLLDEDYEQEIGFPGEGRNFRVGFSLDL
ncbi:TonB-dependent receptor plug domain-containing protein [Desulforapulum autotrophicum]|uniref:TonB-dependent receptor plug domain-containing protein n=1 Tax=Desulforapulum autotrophicum TaxID=2296 RepID=UPI0002E69FA6|nr:TonB-dependent receptor [Desulforapulum autotrophicum]